LLKSVCRTIKFIAVPQQCNSLNCFRLIIFPLLHHTYPMAYYFDNIMPNYPKHYELLILSYLSLMLLFRLRVIKEHSYVLFTMEDEIEKITFVPLHISK
jgi:hypothetical protein